MSAYLSDCHKGGAAMRADNTCVCGSSCCNGGGYCTCPDEDRDACHHRHRPTPTGVILTDGELRALVDFFGEDGTMGDDVYDRVGGKFREAATKAGLLKEEPFFEVGKTYRRGRKIITVTHVDTHPVRGDKYAHGWITETLPGTPELTVWPGSVKIFADWKEVEA